MQITDRQKEILCVIQKFMQDTGMPPTVREIAKITGLSVATVHEHLRKLEKAGCIRIERGKARGIRVCGWCAEVEELPILGRAPAGMPVFAEENFEGTVPVAREFVGEGEHFVVRVYGDSMEGEGIREGDLLIVKKQEAAHSGQIVVALVDGEVTVKKFLKSKGRVLLVPANPRYESIEMREEDRILGRVVGLVRRYP